MTLFELKNCVDLFKKAKHDFARLDELASLYDLFNLVCTLNHLPDWIKKDERGMLPELFRRDADRLAKSDEMETIRQLCNRAKHFEKRKDYPKISIMKGYGAGRYGKGPYGVGEPSYEVEIGGKMVSVVDLCGDLLRKWERHFRNHDLL